MDDINEIKARVEGSQTWKLFRAKYVEDHPDDIFDLDNEPEETLEQKLKDAGYENPTALIKARRDYQAEQNYFNSGEERDGENDKEKKSETELKGHKKVHRRHEEHLHELTHDEFEEDANERAQSAADEWEKTKDLSKARNRQEAFGKAKQARYDDLALKSPLLARSWSETLQKAGKPVNEHLEKSIKKEIAERRKIQKNPGARQKILRTAGATILAGSMLGAPIPAPSEPSASAQPQGITISIPRPTIIRNPGIRLPQVSTAGYGPRNLATRGARTLGKNLAKTAAKTVEKQAARAAIGAVVGALASVPLLIILFFILIIVLVLLPIMFFFGSGSTTSPTLPGGVGYWIAAPEKVENGQNIDYKILFAYDPKASDAPGINSLSLIDNIPPEADLVSATDPKTCDPACDSTAETVTWRISSFQPISGQTGGDILFFRFDITLKPTENDVALVNYLCLGIDEQPPICPDIFDASPDESAEVDENPPPSPSATPNPVL